MTEPPRPDLLTGTVTFLFSDIEGSTRLASSLGAEWGALLEGHRALLRAAWIAHGGVEVGTEGDSFFVTFSSASRAVDAAVAAQRSLASAPWPDGARIRVRIGMHTGEASFSSGTYAGLNVHRAARIAGVAHGGQVLLSAATRGLVASGLPPGISLRDLGDHRLKDLDEPERIWQVVVDGLDNDFPPIRSLDATPNNLPSPRTSFLGREREIAELVELLGEVRLLTLTGPGGTGKTRLSLEVAAAALARFPDGVFLVELTSIVDPGLVVPTVTQTLNLSDRGGRTPEERLVDHIGARSMLLVLDNFEHLIEGAASISHLLAACPNLKVIVSSRAVLNVAGEQEYLVPPLGLPDPDHLPHPDQLTQYESVALFIERARSVKPGFAVTNENAPAVAEICVRLDGLPLAIELAAARIRVLTPQAMLGRLADRLHLLSGGSRDLPERQQTLRGAIAWSHDMLHEADQSLFAALSVFVGGVTIETAERVTAEFVETDVLDGLSSLVEKSLVRQSEGTDGQPRFTMLETIREYAVEQAEARGWAQHLQSAHAAAFADLAEATGPAVMGPEHRRHLDRLEEEHDNLRAAVNWAVENGEAAIALRLTSRLWRFWQRRGYLAEATERIEAALAMPNSQYHPELRADALSAAAGIAYWQADNERSRAWYNQEIEARRALGDRAGEADALYGISFTWAISEVIGTGAGTDEARAAIDQALTIYRDLGDQGGIGRSEWALGNAYYSMNELDAAVEHAERARGVFQQAGDQFMVGWATFTIGISKLAKAAAGDTDPELVAAAGAALTESLQVFSAAQDVSGYTLVLDALAVHAFRSGDRERAAILSGAVRMLERATGTGLNLWNRALLGFDPETLTRSPEWAEAVARGESMTAEETVAYALGS